jgi:SAM-dependent methyltransferase
VSGNLKDRLRETWLFPRYLGALHTRRSLEAIHPDLAGVLLDVGCGRRPYEPLFAGRVRKYVGVDRPAYAGAARPHVIGDALDLPVAGSSVDVVLAMEIMEHVPEPARFLAEAARVLKPGGRLVLSVPFMEPLHEEPRDFYRFTPYGVARLLDQHGFAPRSINRKGGWWSVVLGSFVSQALYDTANPPRFDGSRGTTIAGVLVTPLCAAVQLLGYVMDLVAPGRRYTLGYVVVAERTARLS